MWLILAAVATACASQQHGDQGPSAAPSSTQRSAPSTAAVTTTTEYPSPTSTTTVPVTTTTEYPSPTSTTTVPVTTTLYDPSEYFEVTFDFADYICEGRSIWDDQYDCVRYYGGQAPFILTPDLYCSGPDYGLTCSVTWYPDELDDYEFVTVNYTEYVCEDTRAGGRDDKDCYLYSGGDPSSSVSRWVDLYCSGSGYSVTCDSEWYPNELDDYEFVTVNSSEYVCEDTYAGGWDDKDCYLYSGGDPSRSVSGWVDLYCSGSGYSMTCDSDDYPSAWDDYVILTIEWSEYICDMGGFSDMPCVRYYGGGPSGYSFWSPDYYCDRWGTSCEPAW